MSTLGILMKPKLVEATLRGEKTETRRVVKPQPAQYETPGEAMGRGKWIEHPAGSGLFRWRFLQKLKGRPKFARTLHGKLKPRYRVGDALYTRETIWQLCRPIWYDAEGKEIVDSRRFNGAGKATRLWEGQAKFMGYEWGGYDEASTKREAGQCGYRLRPGIHAPKWTARAHLTVVGVRIERLNEITAAAAKAEGVGPILNGAYVGHVKRFVHLWDEINEERGFAYERNPWVMVYQYRLTGKPHGDMPTGASERGTK